MIHEYFPEEWIALNRELQHHPLLAEKLAQYRADELEEKFGEIAAYMGIILDGMYTPGETTKLAGIMAEKLSLHRPVSEHVEIILPLSETGKTH